MSKLKNHIFLPFVLATVFLSPQPAMGGGNNPIIKGQFTADPTARVFNNKVYLYPSHDILPPPPGEVSGLRENWFCMEDYHVFSSDNLSDWSDHGIIVSQRQVPWGNPSAYSMWAPDCVEKNGKYYFYFPDAPKSGHGFAIGVATADKPEGPFTCEPEPIKGVTGIDPCVLIDDDGQAYIYWSGMGIRGSRLKSDMTELDSELTEVKMPKREGMPDMPPMMVGGQQMEGLPEGFKEGPFAFKRNGWYYLSFPWVRKEGGTETLAYAMSKSPLGPWDFKGIIMAEHDNNCWTNHHSLVEFKGQWYLFYHRNHYSPSMDKRRSTCIERVSFRADGTIVEVKQTLRGVGTSRATDQIEIDRYSAISEGGTIAYHDTTDCFRGWYVTLPQKGSWVSYENVDFGNLAAEPQSAVKDDSYLVVRAKASANTAFCIREKSANGKVVAKFQMTVVSESGPFRRDMSGQWITLAQPLLYTPKGLTDLVVTCEGEAVSIDWLQFKNRPDYFAPTAMSPAPAQPDEQGFIRRWTLLEPIKQDIRSNVIFTDSWLRDVFAKTWFKDQMTILPKDGETSKCADGKKRRWHALDSEDYNFKLFRFAEKWGEQTYGSLFWAVTVIDCPEEQRDIRMAAGSNGASMWWLNGEEVLLLSGDRRMVKDDGMSPRLTLRKGHNVLRCAVINGPGLSDMCVRFVDEQGKPVTNYKVIQPSQARLLQLKR